MFGYKWNSFFLSVCTIDVYVCTFLGNKISINQSINQCSTIENSVRMWRLPHDVQFSCAINQPLMAHHWRVHQCLLTSRFIAPSIPWGVSAPGGKMRKQLLKDHNFLNNSIYLLFQNTAYNTFQLEKLFWIKWKILDTIILWQDVGPCCEHISLWSRIKSWPGAGCLQRLAPSDVVGSSQLRLCHTCFINVMQANKTYSSTMQGATANDRNYHIQSGLHDFGSMPFRNPLKSWATLNRLQLRLWGCLYINETTVNTSVGQTFPYVKKWELIALMVSC